MAKKFLKIFLLVPIIGSIVLGVSYLLEKPKQSNVLSYEVDSHELTLKFYWVDDDGEKYKTFENLKTDLESENKELIFAMNGGMFNPNFSPQGLYIEYGVEKAKLDTTKEGYGNFYLQPNGVFYLSKANEPYICITDSFKASSNINYATQSGPMLLIDDEIHPAFNEGSSNLNIRNGVGVLPNGNVLFAMSKEETNFYDFAMFFKDLGCSNALYLDGFVSRTYLPSEDYTDLEGDFGVIIAVIED